MVRERSGSVDADPFVANVSSGDSPFSQQRAGMRGVRSNSVGVTSGPVWSTGPRRRGSELEEIVVEDDEQFADAEVEGDRGLGEEQEWTGNQRSYGTRR